MPPSEPTGEGKDAGLPPLHHRSALHGRSTPLPQITTAPLSFCHEPKVSRSARKHPLLTIVRAPVPPRPNPYRGQPRPRPDLRS
jgi:hypothetical protein